MFDIDPRDETPVNLNADQQAVLRKALSTCCSGLQTLHEFATKGILDAELCRNVLTTTEHELSNVSKIVGVEIDSTAKIERRHEKIRSANMRIHELEAQLGAAVGPAHIQKGMERLKKRLDSWWDLEGFGFITDAKFNSYGNCEVTFSCSLFGSNFGMFSATPVSDKERYALWVADLRARGFVLMNSRHEKNVVVDSDANRTALGQLFGLRLPSAHIASYTNHGNSEGMFSMRDVQVIIRDLADIEALPQMPKEG